MRQEVIARSLLKRVGTPANLWVVLGLAGLFCLFRVLGGPRPSWVELALPFVVLLAHLALAPVPWQWTGTDAPRAGLFRGFLQALLFHPAWILPLMLLLSQGPLPEGPPPHGPPPLHEADRPGPGHPPHGPGPFPSMFGLLNLAFALAFGWVLSEKEAMELREQRTADLLRASQSRSLQNQLEPHVLYNALNSLSELVHDDPAAAEEVIARLADLYRMLTRCNRLSRMPLGEERRLVEAYLAMEGMRLGPRLRLAWDWPDWADALEVPPLLLQPLVENAVKHGISPCDAGGDLAIACAGDGGAVELTVRNGGRPLGERRPGGVGLANLEARLALWRPATATFTLERQGDLTVARLRWEPSEQA